MKIKTGLVLILHAIIATNAIAQNLPPTAPTNNQQTQKSPETQNKPTKTAQFSDWIMTCRSLEGSEQAGQLCELVQTIIINGQKSPFAQIAIGRPKIGMPIQLTVVVPHNVSFPSSVKIATDEKDKTPLEATWARCIPMGCFANAVLKDDLLKKWAILESQGRITFKAANGQELIMPISFKGLKSALDTLSKENK